MIEDQVWYIADEIPEGTAAAIALIEHRWAIPLRSAILNAGGFLVSDAWIHPTDLVAIGLLASEEMAESYGAEVHGAGAAAKGRPGPVYVWGVKSQTWRVDTHPMRARPHVPAFALLWVALCLLSDCVRSDVDRCLRHRSGRSTTGHAGDCRRHAPRVRPAG